MYVEGGRDKDVNKEKQHLDPVGRWITEPQWVCDTRPGGHDLSEGQKWENRPPVASEVTELARRWEEKTSVCDTLETTVDRPCLED